MVGAEPVIWMANEGEAVTETEEITESTRTDVFLQFTVVFLSNAGRDNGLGMVYEPKVTPLTLPLMITVVFLQPYKLII